MLVIGYYQFLLITDPQGALSPLSFPSARTRLRPNATTSRPTARLRPARDARRVQLGLKLNF
jgi:hypothetical protein